MYTYLVDLEKAFDRVLRKVLEWAMRMRYTRDNDESSDEFV